MLVRPILLLVAIAVAQGQVINPGFENVGGWTESSDNFGDVVCCDNICGSNFAFEGDCWAFFGGINLLENAEASQLISVPVGTSSLTYYLSIGYSGNYTSDPGAYFRVSMDSITLATYNYLNVSDNYQLKSHSINSFADGGNHVLRFTHFNPSVPTGQRFNHHLDLVNINIVPAATTKPLTTQPLTTSPQGTPTTQSLTTSPTTDDGSGLLSTDDNRGMSTSTIIAIAVVVPLVIIVCGVVLLVIVILLRKNNHKRQKPDAKSIELSPAPPVYHNGPSAQPIPQTPPPYQPTYGMSPISSDQGAQYNNNPAMMQQQSAMQMPHMVMTPTNQQYVAAPNQQFVGSNQQYPGMNVGQPTTHQSVNYSQFSTGASNQSLVPAPSTTSKLREKGIEIDFNEIENLQEIGKGSFGVVYRGIWRSIPVAVKVLNKDSISNEKAIADFRSEAEILKSLRNHPNVVLFLAITGPPQPVSILTEYCSNGSLYRLLKSNKEINFDLQMKIAGGIARGMLHLHYEKLIHRDLAARNILLTENYEPKVSDFGLTRQHIEADANKTISDIGPLKWMAPESITTKSYSFASDVWSYGVVLWELITRSDPFPELEPINVAMGVCYENLRLKIPDNCDPFFADIMTSCWSTDPLSRPSFKTLCAKFNTREGSKSGSASETYDSSNSNSASKASKGESSQKGPSNNSSGTKGPSSTSLGQSNNSASYKAFVPTDYGSMDKVVAQNSAPAPVDYARMPSVRTSQPSFINEAVDYGVPKISPPRSPEQQ